MARLIEISSPFIKIIRPINLIIVGITQYLLYYGIISQYTVVHDRNPILFALFVIDTLIITASGYVINDIFDKDIDTTNKPSKSYIPHPISLPKAYKYYITLVFLGFLIAAYIALKINNLPYLLIYPLAIGLLYLYSSYLKSTVLWGNILISLYIASVPGILLVYDQTWVQSSDQSVIIYYLFGANMILSFLTNLSREIIKDIEDIEGDAMAGVTTLPIKYGVSLSKKISIGAMTACMLILIWPMICNSLDQKINLWIGSLLLFNSYIILKLILTSSDKQSFTKISTYHKIYMVMGLCAFIYISKQLTL
jgi:4-hydroxybenzoate polyprenyltransferase